MKRITLTRDGIDLKTVFTEELKNATDDEYIAFLEDAILVLQDELLSKQYSFE
jgi:hypothetical protein